jgi:ATP-dependent Clp protease ATP-binding subunit ClpA
VNALDSNPRCVLLLDEIEKAHQDVYNILLQVMDDGRITNTTGKTVSFRNAILIMTSNAGAAGLDKRSIGFSRDDKPEIDEAAIKRIFAPEFRNRLDAVVRFDRLHSDSMLLIVDKFLRQVSEMAQARDVEIVATDAARQWLATSGYDPAMGARPLSRVIHASVKKPLSRMMLVGSLKAGGKATLDVQDDKLMVDAV